MMRINPFYGLVGFIALLLLITPFSRVYQVNLLFTLSLIAASGYAGGVWIMIALRDRGDAVLFTKDALRRSRATKTISRTDETTTGLPGLAAIPYGGFVAPALNVPDKNLGVVPLASVEELSPATTLIYSPTAPLKNPRLLKSINAFFAKNADSNIFVSFGTHEKSTSEVRFGLLNGLTSPITTEALMRQERMVNSQGGLVDKLERAEGGEESNQEQIRRMIRVVKKKTPAEKAKSLIFGSTKTDSKSEKPSQREPQG